jgi:hypothetical protein
MSRTMSRLAQAHHDVSMSRTVSQPPMRITIPSMSRTMSRLSMSEPCPLTHMRITMYRPCQELPCSGYPCASQMYRPCFAKKLMSLAAHAHHDTQDRVILPYLTREFSNSEGIIICVFFGTTLPLWGAFTQSPASRCTVHVTGNYVSAAHAYHDVPPMS